MADLKSWELPLGRQALELLGIGQHKVADKLVDYNNLAAFIPYFLTGGHGSAEALDNLAKYGFNRPDRNEDGKYKSGRVGTMADILEASQIASYSPLVSLGRVGARKLISEPSSTLSEARRAFLLGKSEGLAKQTPEEIIAATKPGYEAVENILQKPVTRRQVNKGLVAGGAAAAAGPALVSKLLSKEAPLVAEQVAAKTIPAAAEAATKYKFNSLAEYLADLKSTAHSGNASAFGDTPEEIMRTLSKNDEIMYQEAKKAHKSGLEPAPYEININPTTGQREVIGWLDAFSPQAKQEMKAWKEMRPQGWTNPNKFELEAISKGFIPNYNGSIVRSPSDKSWGHYNPGNNSEFTTGFSSYDEAQEALTKVLSSMWK